jgi:raffinose/stachyose/melibiose transport system permease protein
MRWISKKKNMAIMMIPSFLVYVFFIIMPVLITIYYSFMKFTGVGEPKFIGLKNYANLFRDPFFFTALKNTCIILVMSVIVLLPLSFLLALLLEKPFRGNGLCKAMIFSPYIIAPILVGVLWVFILDPYMGLINALLRAIGLDKFALEWIGGKTLTPYSVTVVYMWQVLGFYTTVIIAGLKQIPSEIHEASQVDGAGKLQNVIYIVLPMLKETITIVVVLIITRSFMIFETVQQLTNGGPNHLSDVLTTYMYYTTFTSNRYGYGMSIATMTFVFAGICSIIYLRNAGSKLKKGGESR